MPYVSRNEKGEIIELHNLANKKGDQWLEESNPEVIDFLKKLGRTDKVKQILSSTDSGMLRIVEDLIDLLMEKQIFTYTELPEAVQEKLVARKQLRQDMNTLQDLINDDDSIL